MTTFLATWEKPGQIALDSAWAKRQAGGSLLDCLETGLTVCEEDESLLAIGRGSLPNQDGDLELDASIMDGRDLSAGAVCALRGISPAIKVARLVKEETPHIMIAGEQARRFAIAKGMTPQNLATAKSIEMYQEWRLGNFEDKYMHTTADHATTDTVTMIGHESPDHFVAASSTSGWSWKLPGRVGDSPIFGAGIYADDEAGAAGATGWGEELWKACASFRAVEYMRNGATAQEACERVIREMMRRQPRSLEMACVVFALDKNGDFGAATSKDTFHLWVCREGEMSVHPYHALS